MSFEILVVTIISEKQYSFIKACCLFLYPGPISAVPTLSEILCCATTASLSLSLFIIKQNCIYVKEHLNRFITDVSSFEYNLRNRKMLPPSKNSIENFKTNIYNHSPNEIKDAPLKEFASKLKEFLLKKWFLLN